MQLLKRPSITRKYKIILSRVILLSPAKRKVGKPAQILSGKKSLKEPPHPFHKNGEKITTMFAGRLLQ